MAIRGTEFRDEYEFELYGEDVIGVLRPLADDEFLPLAAFLAEHFDMDDDIEQEAAVSEAIDEVEEARDDEDEAVDVRKLDEEFVTIMQEAAIQGLVGEVDPETDEEIEYNEDEREEIVLSLMGGYSVELGGKVLEISGDVRDAEKFRGTRGSVAGSRNSE
jgi:hypothetical protein